MKKILSMIAAAMLLLSAAFAEEYLSIGDMAVPERWSATYQVGKNTVTVDIQPTIPAVDELPVLKVAPSFWLPQPKAGAAWTLQTERVAEGAFHLWTENVETVAANVRTTQGSGFVYGPFDDNAKYIVDSDLTMAQMKAQLEEIFATMENAESTYTADHVHYLNPHTSKKGYAYIMNLHQQLAGAPLWGHAIYSVSNPADEDMSYWPNFILTMQDDGNYELLGRTVKETAVLAADIPLCGFDKVKATVEKEIEAGHIRAVYGVDLGYALYNEPGVTRKIDGTFDWMQSAEFYAVPAWRVLCLYTGDAGKTLKESTYANPGTSQYYEELYINAQTGALLDPAQRGQGTADYTGHMAWSDVR